ACDERGLVGGLELGVDLFESQFARHGFGGGARVAAGHDHAHAVRAQRGARAATSMPSSANRRALPSAAVFPGTARLQPGSVLLPLPLSSDSPNEEEPGWSLAVPGE